MKMKLLIFAVVLLTGIQSIAQTGVAINTTGADADNSAILDVSSTEKGFLPPRLTEEQRNNILNPAVGLILWCSNCGTSGELQVFNGTSWINLAGGAPAPFACGNQLVDARDGKSYSTVLIGTQCWMAQNLNVGTKITGATTQTNNSTIEKYCYDDNDANCTVYGGLYQWDEIMQYVTTEGAQGICPTGWHVPTDGEWSALTTFLGGASVAGGKMKETGTTHWKSPNDWATNSSGFTGLPGGLRNNFNGSFEKQSEFGYRWSSSQYDSTMAKGQHLYYTTPEVYINTGFKTSGFSVRCLKDN